MIWVIAGTLDGRQLAVKLAEETKESIFVSVVSEYGSQLAQHEGIEVHTGRLNEDAMRKIIRTKHIKLMVDASHPYAAVVTETAAKAAEEERVPYIRYERKEAELPIYDRLHRVSGEVEAAILAGSLGSRIYLTTGSKTLPVFVKAEALKNKEVWARVLPTAEVIAECEALGLSPKYIIGMQGPFSYAMNRLMFEETKAEVVIMKNSGLVGGTDTKLAAAMDLGVHIVLIDRPWPLANKNIVHTPEMVVQLWRRESDGVY